MDNRYDINRIEELAYKLDQGTLTEAEQTEFNEWYNSFSDQELKLPEGSTLNPLAIRDRMHNKLLSKIKSNPVKVMKLWPRIIGVAAAVAAITLGVWLYYASNLNGRHPEGSAATRDLLANDIAPGKNTATIKIGDGEAITLSDKQTGVIVGDELRYSDNTFVIQSEREGSRSLGTRDDKGKVMTVTTPRGGTYQVTLPDGTKVWLNAASSLTYTMPLKERGGIRKVELSGEAYFEVFRNKNQPFVVTTKNLTTTVLGTHFNISAYDDEGSTKATLLEGSVKVSTLHSLAPPGRDAVGREGNVVLKPNQQAAVTGSTGIAVKEVDATDVVLWKDGKFSFTSEEIASVMNKVSRWYNVEVIYKDNVQQIKVNGSVSRFANVSTLLGMLEETGLVHFKIEGRKVYVTK